MSRCKKRSFAILLVSLFTCVALGSLCLACTVEESNPQNPTTTEEGSATTEGGSIMATEETIAANAAIVLSYYEKLGFDPAPDSREGSAEEAAALFSSVSNARIKTISSDPDPYERGPITLMVTDENEQDFVLYLTSYGSVEVIEDGDGKMVLGVVE